MAAGPFTPVIRGYTQALTLLPTDAFVIDRLGVGTEYILGQTLADSVALLITTPYFAAFEFIGGVAPVVSECMGGHAFTVAVDFPVDFAGAQGHVEIPPLDPFVITIAKIASGVATDIGTITIATDGTFAFASGAAAFSFAPSDSLRFTAQVDLDLDLANIWWTLQGSLA